MINKRINEDIKKTARNVKSSEKAIEAANNMKKIIKSNKYNIFK